MDNVDVYRARRVAALLVAGWGAACGATGNSDPGERNLDPAGAEDIGSVNLALCYEVSPGSGGVVGSTGGSDTGCPARYHAVIKANGCANFTSSCDSGTLLTGRGTVGPETNQPSTLFNSCADGIAGTYLVDESIERIKVRSLDNSLMIVGQTVRIEVTVNVWDTADNRLDLYHASNDLTLNPNLSWTLVQTIVPPATGIQTLTATYVLPAGPLQAVRANFRRHGSASPCSTERFDDHDDLAFRVKP